jgi:hypothetical protein
MTTTEQEILALVHELDIDEQHQVLEMIKSFISEKSIEGSSTTKHYTARELMRLPLGERNRLVKAAFDKAANDEFGIFEANEFIEDDDQDEVYDTP